MNIDEAAAELYGTPLDEFMSVRTDLERRAKADDDPDIAKQIKALRKPVAAAWVLNQLVRSDIQQVSDLVALGEAMRSATAASDGDTLRDLTATRKKAIAELVGRAKKLASDAGQPVSADMVNAINDTLLAAVADAEAGAELLEGRLTKPLKHAGFGSLPSDASADVISLNAARTKRGTERSARKADTKRTGASSETGDDARQAALQELTDADAALEEAETRVSTLRTRASEVRERVDESRSRVEQLSAELDAAQRALRDAEVAAESVDEELETARRDVETAGRRRRDARLAAHRYTS